MKSLKGITGMNQIFLYGNFTNFSHSLSNSTTYRKFAPLQKKKSLIILVIQQQLQDRVVLSALKSLMIHDVLLFFVAMYFALCVGIGCIVKNIRLPVAEESGTS